MIAPKPKKEIERDVEFVKGGKGTANKMFDKQSAGPAVPARTGKTPTAAPGKKFAAGGKGKIGHPEATPARPGHTAPVKKGR